jgi:preprotein translocase subunit SecD
MTSLTRAAFVVLTSVVGAAPVSAEKPADKPQVRLELRRAETKPGEGLTEATVAGTSQKIYLHKKAEIDNKDIARARAMEDDRGHPAIEVVFTREGARKAARMSEAHKGKPLAILLNGKVVGAPVVRDRLSDHALITGTFTQKEVDRLVKGMSGK